MKTTTAKLRFLRIAPRKVRLVIDLVRGKDVMRAEAILKNTAKGAARPVGKLLASAVANAVNNEKMEKTNLYIKAITADEGPTLKRFKPRAYGRATEIRKRSTHVTITLAERKKGNKADKGAKTAGAKSKLKLVKKDKMPKVKAKADKEKSK
jgi:large subunit ribosomal protein L22